MVNISSKRYTEVNEIQNMSDEELRAELNRLSAEQGIKVVPI